MLFMLYACWLPAVLLSQGARGGPGDQGPEGTSGSKVRTFKIHLVSHILTLVNISLSPLTGRARAEGGLWTSGWSRHRVPWSEGTFGFAQDLNELRTDQKADVRPADLSSVHFMLQGDKGNQGRPGPPGSTGLGEPGSPVSSQNLVKI